MKHIVYLKPNAPELDNGTLVDLCRAATINPRETLEGLRARSDVDVTVFDSLGRFAQAFNDETISDQGYLLVIDDRVSERNLILAAIRVATCEKGTTIPAERENTHTCKVIDLLPGKDLDWDKIDDADEAMRTICEDLPTYLVASNRDGEWFEEKVRRVILSDNGTLSFELESGFIVDATEPFIENLVTIKDILERLDKDAVTEFHQKYA